MQYITTHRELVCSFSSNKIPPSRLLLKIYFCSYLKTIIDKLAHFPRPKLSGKLRVMKKVVEKKVNIVGLERWASIITRKCVSVKNMIRNLLRARTIRHT